MASRWMQPKLDKLRRDRPPFDPNKRAGHSIALSERISAELAELRKSYTGVVTVAKPGAKLNPIGKGRRVYSRATYGNGTRRTGSLLTPDVFVFDDRLIRAGE